MRGPISERLDALDWAQLGESIEERGYLLTPPLLGAAQCRRLRDCYREESRFRTTVVMARHRFGLGEYRYFREPLPPVVAELRTALYPHLAVIANTWQAALGLSPFPEQFERYRAHCHAAGQIRPTPLLLRYEPGGYNCLHQDRYGKLAFPLQATFLLSRPEADFGGGEFLLVENRPRAQSRGTAIALDRGQCIVFPNQIRPARGKRGFYRLHVRHGVSTVTHGVRFALGVIFHDSV